MKNLEYKKLLNNNNFSKLIITENNKINDFKDHDYKNLEVSNYDNLKLLLEEKKIFDIIILSEILTSINNIAEILKIINNLSNSKTRVIVHNKTFFYHIIKKILRL